MKASLWIAFAVLVAVAAASVPVAERGTALKSIIHRVVAIAAESTSPPVKLCRFCGAVQFLDVLMIISYCFDYVLLQALTRISSGLAT